MLEDRAKDIVNRSGNEYASASALTSIAISLKRIADMMQKDQYSKDWNLDEFDYTKPASAP